MPEEMEAAWPGDSKFFAFEKNGPAIEERAHRELLPCVTVAGKPLAHGTDHDLPHLQSVFAGFDGHFPLICGIRIPAMDAVNGKKFGDGEDGCDEGNESD